MQKVFSLRTSATAVHYSQKTQSSQHDDANKTLPRHEIFYEKFTARDFANAAKLIKDVDLKPEERDLWKECFQNLLSNDEKKTLAFSTRDYDKDYAVLCLEVLLDQKNYHHAFVLTFRDGRVEIPEDHANAAEYHIYSDIPNVPEAARLIRQKNATRPEIRPGSEPLFEALFAELERFPAGAQSC